MFGIALAAAIFRAVIRPLELLTLVATLIAFGYSLRLIGPYPWRHKRSASMREYVGQRGLRTLPATLLFSLLVAWIATILVRAVGIPY